MRPAVASLTVLWLTIATVASSRANHDVFLSNEAEVLREKT
jgi:hypothetical protein